MDKIYKIILKNGTELNCVSVLGRHQFIKGDTRDSLTFSFDSEYSVDSLINLFGNEDNTSEINVIKIDEENVQGIYYDYSIFSSAAVNFETVSAETNENEEEKALLTKIVMGQVSYSEKLQKQQGEQLNDLSEVVADMLGGAL